MVDRYNRLYIWCYVANNKSTLPLLYHSPKIRISSSMKARHVTVSCPSACRGSTWGYDIEVRRVELSSMNSLESYSHSLTEEIARSSDCFIVPKTSKRNSEMIRKMRSEKLFVAVYSLVQQVHASHEPPFWSMDLAPGSSLRWLAGSVTQCNTRDRQDHEKQAILFLEREVDCFLTMSRTPLRFWLNH